MEVIGRRSLTETNSVFCKQCVDENKQVPANGLCRECEEYMCIACFGSHKKYKVCKDHDMLDIETKVEPKTNREEEESFVPCPKHNKEQVKFYCKCHEDVGCGDCMILYHKYCKVDYIADFTDTFKESKEFADTAKNVTACQTEINECLESIQNNNIQVEDIHQGFISNMNTFRDELITKLDKQEEKILRKASDIHRREKNDITSLETECKEMKDNLAQIHNSISSNCSKTNLFINTVKAKRAIKEYKPNLRNFKSRNTISKYNFKTNDKMHKLLNEIELGGIYITNDDETPSPDSHDCTGYYEKPVTHTQALKQNENEDNVAGQNDGYEIERHVSISSIESNSVCQNNTYKEGYEKLGTSIEEGAKCKYVYEDTMSTTDSQDYEDLIYEDISQSPQSPQSPQSNITRRRSSSKRKNYSLFESQLRCENILMAGDIVSFKENDKGGFGLFVGKRSIKSKTYFEVEILSTSHNGNISIGFVPKDYSSKEQLGDGRFSMGYQTIDGCIHCDSASNKRISPPCKIGDVIGIGVSSFLTNVFKTSISIFVTRNFQKIGKMDVNNPCNCKLYPAVGLKTINDKGRVVMDAVLP